MDLQDDRRSDLPYLEITEKIIGCAFEVNNELRIWFREIILFILSIHVHLFCSKTYA